MKTTLATPIGIRAYLRIYWGDNCKTSGCHNAMKHLKDSPDENWELGGKVEDYPFDQWPTHCDCGEPVPVDNITKQIHRKTLYDTPSGKLEPGNLYWVSYLPENMYWDNHKGPHLHAILPNGYGWNIDSRASNCTKPEDRTHRCWVRHGEVPNIHVDKNGHTCSAGAGSIIGGDWHGFLHHGQFNKC